MLETFTIAITQVAILFILIAVGFYLCKRDVLNDTVRHGITTVLFDFVTPCLIISKMQVERTPERMTGLAVTAGIMAVYFVFAILLSVPLARRKNQSKATEASKRICMIYTNCGFMGFPLLTSLSAIVGSDALFYGSVIIGVNNLFIFTQGIAVFGADKSSDKKERLKRTVKMLLSPAVISVFIGLALFFSGLHIPSVIEMPIDYIGSMNTPLAMLVIGAIICKSDILSIFKDKRIYFTALVRNFIFPLLFFGVTTLFRLNSAAVLICIVIASCPVAGNAAIFSERYGGDSRLSSGVFTLSTLLSAISLPVVITLATVALG